MSDFQIEKGVPVPNAVSGRPYHETWRDRMEVSDSVIVPSFAHVNAARTWARRHGIKFATRKEGSGFRIWRIA